MAGQTGSTPMWTLNEKLPVVFGTGSVLGFLEQNPVDRITVIYKPLMWNVSERIMLIESQGKQYAYYPSDMETKIFADKAVTASWGGKLVFIPRSELVRRQPGHAGEARPALRRRPPAVREGRLEGRRQRRAVGGADARPARLPGVPAEGPVQVAASSSSPRRCTARIDDLVGMDDIKSEVRRSRTSTSGAPSTRSTASTSRST